MRALCFEHLSLHRPHSADVQIRQQNKGASAGAGKQRTCAGEGVLCYELGHVSRHYYATLQVLLSTEMAARGLDLPRLSHIVNFDLPHSAREYVTRNAVLGPCLITRCTLLLLVQVHPPRRSRGPHFQPYPRSYWHGRFLVWFPNLLRLIKV
jgi:hypothetical protein